MTRPGLAPAPAPASAPGTLLDNISYLTTFKQKLLHSHLHTPDQQQVGR